MKLAVLSDVHGGYVALQACLERAFAEQVDAIGLIFRKFIGTRQLLR